MSSRRFASVVTRGIGDAEHHRVHVATNETPAWEHLITASATAHDVAARADGEWVVLADDGDELHPAALGALRSAASNEVDVVYSDHAVFDERHVTLTPVFKPDFSPERLRHVNYIGPGLLAIRRSLLASLGTVDTSVTSHRLALEATERAQVVAHVPQVLYHRRYHQPMPVADRHAVEAHLRSIRLRATVSQLSAEVLRIDRSTAHLPLISVVIPTRGSTGRVWGRNRRFVVDAVRSIVSGSTVTNIEFVVVADRDTDAVVRHQLQAVAGDRLVWLTYDHEFNFSAKVNLGAAASSGRLLLLLNDDTELIAADSIAHMAGFLRDHEDLPHGAVGAVGARLLYSDGTLQHGGHVYSHQFMHACIGWTGDSPGPDLVLASPRECSGVTAAALMVPKRVFEEVGGFPEALPLHFNDVAFCLSVRDTGRRVLWTPHASWYHFEGKTRDRSATMDEYRYIESRWPEIIHRDPYYNPNLASRRSDWVAAVPDGAGWSL
jgi:O-antigen biosynthesis protein